MLKLGDLAAYVQAAAPAGTTVYINRMPDVLPNDPTSPPVQVVMVAIAHGGRGFLVDGAFQEVVIHTRSRASTDEEAETVALAVDAALLNTTPAQMGSAYVRNAYPAAGPPCFFERDVENNTIYFCDYFLEVSR